MINQAAQSPINIITDLLKTPILVLLIVSISFMFPISLISALNLLFPPFFALNLFYSSFSNFLG